MATFTAYQSTDLTKISFHDLYGRDYEFENNVNEKYKSTCSRLTGWSPTSATHPVSC